MIELFVARFKYIVGDSPKLCVIQVYNVGDL